MSSGSYSFDAPHFCGELIHVEVKYDYDPGVYTFRNGDPGYPPSYDEEHVYTHESKDYDIEKCPKCGVDLLEDSIFQETIKQIVNRMTPNEVEMEPDFDLEDDLLEATENWEAEESYRQANE